MTEPAVQNNPASRPGGVTGKGWVKGQSGNPSGRPKGLAHATREILKRAVGEGEDEALVLARFWASVMADPKAKMEHRLQAADRLADRGWGKPPQYAPIEDADPLDFGDREAVEIAAEFDSRLDELAKRRESKAA
jgi:Family of unknown function (DUF5681)